MKRRFLQVLVILAMMVITGQFLALKEVHGAPPPQLAFTYHDNWWSADSYSADASTCRTVSGDFNGDGLGDIAMIHRTNSTTARFYVILGAIDHFEQHTIWLTLNLDANTMTGKVVAGDFNNDGYDDVAAFADNPTNYATILYVFLSDGSSFGSTPWWSDFGYFDRLTGRVVAGDFDGDGWEDDITGLFDAGANNIRADVFISDGSGFSDPQYWWSRGGFIPDNATYRTVAGDLDADGDDDVVMIYKYTATETHAHVLRSSGSAFNYEARWWEDDAYMADRTAGRVVAGDFDGDGDDDVSLLYADPNNNDPSHIQAHILLSTRQDFAIHGDVSSFWWEHFSYNPAYAAGRVVAGDWDGNGVDDVSMIYRTSSSSTRAQVLEATAVPPGPATTRQVDGSDPACDDGSGMPYCTIQAAVDAANDDDTIQVAAGIYSELVTAPRYGVAGFNQSLTISGAGVGQTTVDGNNFGSVIAIHEGGRLILSGLTIRNGLASNGGGIYSDGGIVAVSNSTINSNYAGYSGGIYNIGGNVIVSDSTLTGNTAQYGGGIHNGNYSIGGNIISTGALTVTNSTLSGNTVDDDGGGILNRDGVVTVSYSTIDGNIAEDYGGGLYSSDEGVAIIFNSTFSGNIAGVGNFLREGGGIFSTGSLIVNNSVFTGNLASSFGGGITSYGVMMVSNSTFSGNTADSGGGIGIFSQNSGASTVSNSTFSGNSATTSQGGAIRTISGMLTLTNSTLSDNSAGNVGGGISLSGATITVTNSIVANNTAGGDCGGPGNWNTSGAPNLDSDGTCTGFTTTDNPLLGPLQDNGGPTQTQALLTGSPAIDAGSNAVCLAADQRGVPRPQDGDGNGTAVCDLGAFEVGQRTVYLPVVVKP